MALNSAQRGYDAKWRRRRRSYVRRHPLCCLCGAPAQVADHYPESRKELIARGVTDPDADRYLRPLCIPCHNKETAKRQPGGFARAAALRKRPRDEGHPGLVDG